LRWLLDLLQEYDRSWLDTNFLFFFVKPVVDGGITSASFPIRQWNQLLSAAAVIGGS